MCPLRGFTEYYSGEYTASFSNKSISPAEKFLPGHHFYKSISPAEKFLPGHHFYKEQMRKHYSFKIQTIQSVPLIDNLEMLNP